MPELEPRLQPGPGFHLREDGQWEVMKIPADVLESASLSGKLTIQGYRCTVFETPDKDQWAQKSETVPILGTVASRVAASWLSTVPQHQCASCATFAWHGPEQSPVRFAGGVHHPSCPELRADTVASKVAARFFEAKGRKRDVTSIVKKIMDRPGDDRSYEKEISKYGKKVRKAAPRAKAAFEKLSAELEKLSTELAEAEHEKVAGHHAGVVADEIGKAVSTVQVAASSLIRNLLKRAEEWDPEE